MLTTAYTVGDSSTFWQALRRALRGEQLDYTQGSITTAIGLLSIPMVLEMIMESLFGLVDVFFVAHLGADAVAAVGLTESLLTPVFAVALGLSIGSTAIVARRIGESRPEEASIAAAQAILVAVGVSAVVGVAGFLFASDLLRLMGATESIVRIGSGYSRTIMSTSGVIFFLFVINAVFRGAGDASIAMRSLWLANIINILLNPCLILGLGPFPEMGVTGSAVGSSIGRGAGVAYQLWMLSSGRSRVKLHLAAIRPNFEIMAKLIRLSIGGMFQHLVNVASWIALVRMAAYFGSAAIAGYTLAIRIIIFGVLPSWGMSNAAATLVGQNLGAKRPDRAEKSVWIAASLNATFLGVLGLVFIIWARPIVSLFTMETEVVNMAATTLRFVSYCYLFYGFGLVIVQSFNGAGDTYTPTMINLFCYWAWQLPLAWWLAFHTSFGVSGIFLAISIAETTLAVLGFVAFRRGTWKTRQV